MFFNESSSELLLLEVVLVAIELLLLFVLEWEFLMEETLDALSEPGLEVCLILIFEASMAIFFWPLCESFELFEGAGLGADKISFSSLFISK